MGGDIIAIAQNISHVCLERSKIDETINLASSEITKAVSSKKQIPANVVKQYNAALLKRAQFCAQLDDYLLEIENIVTSNHGMNSNRLDDDKEYEDETMQQDWIKYSDKDMKPISDISGPIYLYDPISLLCRRYDTLANAVQWIMSTHRNIGTKSDRITSKTVSNRIGEACKGNVGAIAACKRMGIIARYDDTIS